MSRLALLALFVTAFVVSFTITELLVWLIER